MDYKVILSHYAQEDCEKHSLAGDRSHVEKIENLKILMAKDPYGRFNRKGRSKKLIHEGEKVYSRKIDRKHRMVYEIDEKAKEVLVHSLLKHYVDK